MTKALKYGILILREGVSKQMFRLVITLGNLKYITKNCATKSEAEDYILEVSAKQEIKRADILNKETNERERVF